MSSKAISSSNFDSKTQFRVSLLVMRLLKYLLFILFFVLLFCFSSENVKASFVVITSGGEVVVNVLSFEDDNSLGVSRNKIEITEVFDKDPDEGSKIYFKREDGSVKLNISTNSSKESFDVTNAGEDIIEIEERPKVEKITIGIKDNKFLISQRDVSVETSYEIGIDPETVGITLTTPSGLRYLSILPSQAAQTILRSKVINRLDGDKTITLEEDAQGELAYHIYGKRIINLFDLVEYKVPVNAKVSASTGEISQIDQPVWLQLVGFIFI